MKRILISGARKKEKDLHSKFKWLSIKRKSYMMPKDLALKEIK